MRWFYLALFCCSLAQAAPGLYPLESESIPGPVKEAAQAVYRVLVIGPKAQRIVSRDYPNALNRLCRGSFLERKVCPLVQTCERQGHSVCEIPYASEGSAFLWQDSQTLMSARHVFEGKTPLKPNEELHFELYNNAGELVFSTQRERVKAQVLAVGMKERIKEKISENLVNIASDFIQISLSMAPLGATKFLVPGGETSHGLPIFALGFPVPTKRREKIHQAPDANGHDLRVSVGEVITAQQFMLKANDFVLSQAQAAQLETVITYIDSDHVSGQSGGPVVNEQGEVIGIIQSHANHPRLLPEDKYHPAGGVSVSWEWIRKAIIYFKLN